MKTLYMCQASTGLLAFTYAESDEEATDYFQALFTQYSPTWLNCTIKTWECSDGWTLPSKEEQYDFDPPKHPYDLVHTKEQLHGYRERREAKEQRRKKKEGKQV